MCENGSMIRKKHLIATLVALGMTTTCSAWNETVLGRLGDEGKAYFDGQDDIEGDIFEGQLAVGSRFSVVVQPAAGENEADVLGAVLTSEDDSVLRVTPAQNDGLAADLEVMGSGETKLLLQNGDEVVDWISVRTARAASLVLLDESLAGSGIDARIPGRFGLIERQSAGIRVRVDNSCGEEIYAPNAFTFSSDRPEVVNIATMASSDRSFLVRSSDSVGEAVISVLLDDVSHEFHIDVIHSYEVGNIETNVASVADQSALLWARAFAGNTEIIGMTYVWENDGGTTLSSTQGAYTQATLAPAGVDAEGNELPLSSAVVAASLFGHRAGLDLLTVSTDQLVSTRVETVATEEDEPSDASAGCDELGATTAACQAAFSIPLLWMRRLRRLRRSRAG